MKGESSQKRSSGTSRDMQISNSRAMGIIVLIALLFVFQVVTFVWQKVRVAGAPGVSGSAEVSGGGWTDRVAGAPRAAGGAGDGGVAAGARFAFDPNTITGDSLQLLGFSARQAQSILKYRNKGGKFRYREDFAKLYVVDSAVYAALEGYLLLPRRGSGTKKGISVPEGAENGAVGTNSAGNVPGGAEVGTKEGISVPRGAENGVAGTKSAGNVPGKGRDADLSGRKLGNADTLGRRTGIYGKRVEKNRYMCNLNTADSAALVKLYGIGGYYARKILRYREALGGSFADVRQLLEIEGFTQERFAGIERSIFVNDSDVKGISLLNAGREFLERHPYIGPYAARGILSYIRLKGKDTFKGELHLLEQLVKERVITQNNAEKLKVYLLSL
ncbi:MAG: helix-hairpin-helix domain-containing protein [Bacteroidales bacterium]|nr:helix-hairpin-helix domain-containing protein [Bacteroidales bacterium]